MKIKKRAGAAPGAAVKKPAETLRKQRKNRRSGSLPAELICCLLGTAAFCSALLPALGQEVGIMDCMLFALVDLSVIFLLSRRWWIAPALVVLAALAGAVAIRFFHVWEPMVEYAEGFIEWVNAAYPYTLPYSENGSQFLVHLAFSFPVTLVLYLYFRRLPFLPLWVLLGGALLVWMYYTKAENLMAVAALLLIAGIVLISRTNAGSINRKLGLTEKIPTAAMQLTALALAPLIVLFAFALGPKEDGAWQSRGLVNLVEDVRDAMSFYGDGSSGNGSFNLSYSGLAPYGATLGGDIDPNNRTVMRVKTSTPMLLSGAVYDTYNGWGWYDTGTLGRFRFSSPLWRGKRREVFAIGKPSSGKAAGLYTQVSKSAYLEVSMAVRFSSLFAAGKPEGLELRNGDSTDVYFNTQGELFLPDFPDLTMYYTLRTRCFDREAENFDDNMRALLELTASGKDKDYAEICETCLTVSESVEPFVWELAEEITADCVSPYDKALALEAWLSENCTYTKTPGHPPTDRDFLSEFLETREGYCTYYATAMTVMARMVGLPARYVTGYGLKQADDRQNTTSYIATNATAHAWTQIYFYGVGWVDFDASGWEFYELVERDQPVPKDPKTDVKPDLPEIDEPEIDLPEEDEPEGMTLPARRNKNKTGRIVLIILGCDLLAFLIFLGVRFVLMFFRVESFYYRLTHKYLDNGTRADVCYRQILKQLGFLGLKMAPADTITSFCTRADAALGEDGGHESVMAVCEPVLLSRFARRKPRDPEIRRMCDFYIAMERRLRKTMGMKKYIIRRMILGR